MNSFAIFTALLAVMATASPSFTTIIRARTRTNVAANVVISTNLPICNFDLTKGEYVCPPTVAGSYKPTSIDIRTTFKKSITVAAAECNRCKANSLECVKVIYVTSTPCKSVVQGTC